jgi:PDZ domain-containing secreted protein
MTGDEIMEYMRERFDKVDDQFDKINSQQLATSAKIDNHREEYIKEITTIKVRWGVVAAVISLAASGVFNFVIGLFRHE